MEQRLTLITLGVDDFEQALAFYRDGLGWNISKASAGDFAVMQLGGGVALALHPRTLLAEDAGIAEAGSGFDGMTLAHNVGSTEEVDRILAEGVAAGGTLLKAAEKKEWGGYSGYFADPDGHAWEIAWNPFFEMENGLLKLP